MPVSVTARAFLYLGRAGFSPQWLLRCRAQALGHESFSSWGSQALQRWLSSCDTQAWLLLSTWDLPGPGIKPVSPALAGRFLTTEPPGTLRMVLKHEHEPSGLPSPHTTRLALLLPHILPQLDRHPVPLFSCHDNSRGRILLRRYRSARI